MAEDRPDLLVLVVGGDPRREDRHRDDDREDDRADRRRGPVLDRLPDEPAPRADGIRLGDGARLVEGDAHSVILGSSLK